MHRSGQQQLSARTYKSCATDERVGVHVLDGEDDDVHAACPGERHGHEVVGMGGSRQSPLGAPVSILAASYAFLR